MKRIASICGLLLISAFALSAAVWDGSAVAGGAADFPDDGYYGACNSFPRDTSVTVTNLENGKTVTVTITRNVDNPGVFIALSPKAASELGMRAGSATRIRAVALVASQAESSLPPTRAGVSADPDYNPQVYVEREKAAAAAAIAPVAAPLAPAPAIAAAPAVAPAVAAAPVPESAEVMPKIGEPKKQPEPALPALSEPKSAAAETPSAPAAAVAPAPAPAPAPVVAPAPAPAPIPAPAVAVAPAKKPQPAVVKPEASPTFPASPQPTAVAAVLPPPDVPAAAAADDSDRYRKPDVIGGNAKPNPNKPGSPRMVFIEPPLPGPVKAAPVVAKAPEKATIDSLKRPNAIKGPVGFALLEPQAVFGPEELPDAVMDRVTAPARLVPTPVLAEAGAPSDLGELRTRPEAICFDKPSYAESVEAAMLEASELTPVGAIAMGIPGKIQGEGVVATLADAELPGMPDAIADRQVAGENEALAELQVPDVPRPVEGIGVEKPAGFAAVAAGGELEEPGVVPPTETGMGPVAFADLRKGPAQSTAGELSDPAVPTPTESLTAGKAKAVAPGEAVAELAEPDPNGRGIAAIGGEAPAKAASPGAALAELAEPDPSGKGVAAIGGAAPTKTASPGTGELASPAVPSPSESIAAERPAVIAGGERTVTLEPAVPRPPVTAAAPAVPTPAPAPAAALVPAKPAAPAAVATVTSPSPAGAVQAPASVPILKGLAKGSFYVQIGVYGTNDALGAAIAGFKSTHYPLAVEKLTTKKGSPAFRLFVGPLSRDESGLVLIRIRSLGFKDAYIRQGT
jgi:hypothetical protein